jgi:hypothetical protein
MPSRLRETDLDLSTHPVLVVMAIAVVAPLLAEIPRGFRLSAVVLEMVLGLARADGLLGWLGGTLGLETLFSMAGMKLARRTDFQGTPGRLWMTGRMSPGAQRQFAALGWTVYPNVLLPWQR